MLTGTVKHRKEAAVPPHDGIGNIALENAGIFYIKDT
jgi:uncharacterized protein YigE (DUF2233 family)